VSHLNVNPTDLADEIFVAPAKSATKAHATNYMFVLIPILVVAVSVAAYAKLHL
jgi:hypothetical protein